MRRWPKKLYRFTFLLAESGLSPQRLQRSLSHLSYRPFSRASVYPSTAKVSGSSSTP